MGSPQTSVGTMEGRRLAGQALIGVGVDLAATGQLDEALEVFQRAQTTLSPVGAATRATSEVDHIGDTDHEQRAPTGVVVADATTATSTACAADASVRCEDDTSNTTPDHVPKASRPSTFCSKRLRRAHDLARRDSISADKKRRTDYATNTASEAPITKGRRRMTATNGGKGNRAAEEIAQAEMYREETSDDLVSAQLSIFTIVRIACIQRVHISQSFLTRIYL